jgi:AcrR family transcriptional regulator
VSPRRPEPASRVVPFADAARSLLRRTVVAAVDELVRARGWAATTMSDVAAAAGVSRQTLYNEFGSRQALVEEYLRAEIDRLLVDVEAQVRAGSSDPTAALRGAFGLFLRLASDEPVVRIIAADAEGGELIRLLTTLGRSIITEVWPQVAGDDAEVLADSLVRLAISHALFPIGTPGQTADDVTRMLAPFVQQIVGASQPGRPGAAAGR